MPQVNYTDIPNYNNTAPNRQRNSTPKNWQDSPDLYPQQLRQNDECSVQIVCGVLAWIVVFFGPAHVMSLYTNHFAQMEAFGQIMSRLGMIIFVLFCVIFAALRYKRKTARSTNRRRRNTSMEWYDNPERYLQNRGRNNDYTIHIICGTLAWIVIFFGPAYFTNLYTKYFVLMEIFSKKMTLMGLGILILFNIVCLILAKMGR